MRMAGLKNGRYRSWQDLGKGVGMAGLGKEAGVSVARLKKDVYVAMEGLGNRHMSTWQEWRTGVPICRCGRTGEQAFEDVA